MQNMKDIAMLLAINHMTGSHSEACASQMNATDLSALKDRLYEEYESYQCKNLKLDMSLRKAGTGSADFVSSHAGCAEQPECFVCFGWYRLPQLWMPGRYSGGKRADGQPFGAARPKA